MFRNVLCEDGNYNCKGHRYRGKSHSPCVDKYINWHHELLFFPIVYKTPRGECRCGVCHLEKSECNLWHTLYWKLCRASLAWALKQDGEPRGSSQSRCLSRMGGGCGRNTPKGYTRSSLRCLLITVSMSLREVGMQPLAYSILETLSGITGLGFKTG